MKLAHIDSTSPSNTFVVSSGALRVTDPCYDADTWCAGTLDDVKNGIWLVHVGHHKDRMELAWTEKWRQEKLEKLKQAKEQGNEALAAMYACEAERYEKSAAEYQGRIAYLHIVHAEAQSHFDPHAEFDSTWENAGIDVGVDSGQAGFFDQALFEQVCADAAVKDKFYDEICHLTSEDGGLVHAIGVVSSTGYGDGSYDCLIRRDDGRVVEAIIVYVPEYEEEAEQC